MRKRVVGSKLSRDTSGRIALTRSLVRALTINGELRTTASRAGMLKAEIDGIMKLVRKGDLSARRRALSKLGNDREVVSELFGKYAELAKSRKSGFVKLNRRGVRVGDGARMVQIEWMQK